MIFGIFTLIVALIISGIAAYYSIIGLTAIFSAAVVPIIIMGAALEVGKITAAVWLKLNWNRANFTYKLYLVPAVAFLMALTSMGIFGFLSKAHSDQNLVSGDAQARIAVYDEKIKTERENIEVSRKGLQQLDAAVDQVMGRSKDERGAERSNQIRRQQQAERTRLQREITTAQNNIVKLQAERAPIAAEIRKVEAEVGPIKYIAALIYDETPSIDLLEKAVRWVIILIVAVFDPLALVLILAAQQSIRWRLEEKKNFKNNLTPIVEKEITPEDKPLPQVDQFNIDDHAYLKKPWKHFGKLEPMVASQPQNQEYKPEPEVTKIIDEVVEEPTKKPIKKSKKKIEPPKVVQEPISVDDLSTESTVKIRVAAGTKRQYKILNDEYLEIEGKIVNKRVLFDLYPDIHADLQNYQNELKTKPSESTFGTEFPPSPTKGQIFLNVKQLPSKLYKFNGDIWIEVDKTLADSYTYNNEYVEFLIDKIKKGHITLDDLTFKEQEQVEEYLKNANTNNNTP